MKTNLATTSQDFEIEAENQYLVRQDRIECDPDRHTVQLSSAETVSVVNFTAFGLVVETNSELKNEYVNAEFKVDGYLINHVSLQKVRQSRDKGSAYVTAFSVVGDPVDVEAALSIKKLNLVLDVATSQLNHNRDINDGFRLKALEIKNLLVSLEAEINGLSKDSFKNEISSISHYEDRIASRVSHYFADILSPIYKELNESVKNLTSDEIAKYFNFFRKTVGDIIYQSAYAHRAYHKPKGYAGDYEMMNHVYHRELRGNTLFAKCLQRYFVDEPAGKAVRNREVYLRAKLKNYIAGSNKKIKLLSVASGPAMEVQNLIQEGLDLNNVEFHLLDQDIDALKFAQRKIMEAARSANKTINVSLHHLAIKNVIQDGLPIKDFDIIYSAGLFDYFTDPVAIYAAKQLFAGLKSGGNLIIGNFSLNNPNQFAMNIIMDWNLIYRSENKMKELFGGLGGRYTLEQEAQGINFFANIKK